jgi:hypothetical protein
MCKIGSQLSGYLSPTLRIQLTQATLQYALIKIIKICKSKSISYSSIVKLSTFLTCKPTIKEKITQHLSIQFTLSKLPRRVCVLLSIQQMFICREFIFDYTS